MSAKARREQERDAFKAAILDAARDIARQDGWQAVTLRGVAQKLDYSAAALYEYFPSKNAILHALLKQGFAELTGALDAANAAQNSAANLSAVAAAYWSWAQANPDLYQVMHGLGGVPFGTIETPTEAVAAFHALQNTVQAALPNDAGFDLEEETDALWAALHGIVSLALAGRIKGGSERAERIVRRTSEIFYAAWRHSGAKK